MKKWSKILYWVIATAIMGAVVLCVARFSLIGRLFMPFTDWLCETFKVDSLMGQGHINEMTASMHMAITYDIFQDYFYAVLQAVFGALLFAIFQYIFKRMKSRFKMKEVNIANISG